MKRRATAIRSRLPFLGVAILATAAFSAVWAETPNSQAPAPKPADSAVAGPQAACSQAAATTPAEAGMRAYIDPETGTIGGMPPAEALPASPQPEPVFEQVVLPDGSVMVDLKGAGQEYFILQLDANGNRVVRCVQDPKTATAPVAPKREER